MRRIKLIEGWRGHKPGVVMEVVEHVGDRLVKDRVAEWVSGARPKRNKVKTAPASVKG